ncbi:phosphoglucosamine mutase, partial [Bacillus paranthracis]|nr:phosphoglucosamine mutase [Bacillus paranthracis]
EAEIESLLDKKVYEVPRPTGTNLLQVSDYFEGGQKYLQYIKQTVDEDISGLHIALDCAHGATSSLAPYLFADLDADISTMGTSPNGMNINDVVVS